MHKKIVNVQLLFTFIILNIFISPIVFSDAYVYFSPSMACENGLVHLIEKSKKTIYVAIYAINNDCIVKALKEAHDRGVKIKILADKTQADSKHSKVSELYEYGINIRLNSKFKIEHNKFAVFDHEIASSGSYNWTNNATKKNSENCIFLLTIKK